MTTTQALETPPSELVFEPGPTPEEEAQRREAYAKVAAEEMAQRLLTKDVATLSDEEKCLLKTFTSLISADSTIGSVVHGTHDPEKSKIVNTSLTSSSLQDS